MPKNKFRQLLHFLFLEFEQCQSLQKVGKKAAQICLKENRKGRPKDIAILHF